jgi:hypothetical protein
LARLDADLKAARALFEAEVARVWRNPERAAGKDLSRVAEQLQAAVWISAACVRVVEGCWRPRHTLLSVFASEPTAGIFDCCSHISIFLLALMLSSHFAPQTHSALPRREAFAFAYLYGSSLPPATPFSSASVNSASGFFFAFASGRGLSRSSQIMCYSRNFERYGRSRGFDND